VPLRCVPRLSALRVDGWPQLLICALQAYVFALLTSLYLNDAVNLH